MITRTVMMGLWIIVGACQLQAVHGQEMRSATVYDGTGNPATGLSIGVYVGENLRQTVMPDALGQVQFTVPADAAKAPQRGQALNFAKRMELRATDGSGQQEVLNYTDLTGGGGSASDQKNLYFSLAPRNTTARVFRGVVRNQDSTPAGGLTFSMEWLSYPGMGGVQFSNPSKLKTAPDGTFCIGIPTDFLRFKVGSEEIPANSQLRINLPGRTQATLSLNQLSAMTINNARPIQFQLLGQDGQPMPGLKHGDSVACQLTRILNQMQPPKAGETRIGSQILGGSARVIDPTAGIIEVKEVPVPGLYELKLNGTIFPRKLLTAESGSNGPVIWNVDDSVSSLVGRVLSAEDGNPIGDAYVINSGDGGTAGKLLTITPQQIELVWKKWLEMAPANQTLTQQRIDYGESQPLFGVTSMCRTLQNGTFRLTFVSGKKPFAVFVIMPGRIGAEASVYKWPIEQDGNIKLPEVAIPLAATVSTSVSAPDRIPDLFLSMETEAKVNGLDSAIFSSNFPRDTSSTKLAMELPPAESSKHPWTLITSTESIRAGTTVTVPVPAGLRFSISARGPSVSTIRPFHWPEQAPLRPAENLQLASGKLGLKTPFVIAVKRPDGSPATDVPVRVDGYGPFMTDKDGNAIGWADGIVRRIDVIKEKSLLSSAATVENVNVDALPEPRTVTIQLK